MFIFLSKNIYYSYISNTYAQKLPVILITFDNACDDECKETQIPVEKNFAHQSSKYDSKVFIFSLSLNLDVYIHFNNVRI